jgi:flavin reductase (DIM6/NTAB) family NADH-FMN oxidoreductase RutF
MGLSMNNNSEALRKAMRQWTTGVCVVCGKNDTLRHGMTVNSFTSVSLEPPLIIVTLANNTRTCNLINETGRFSVSILRQNQKAVADRFSGKDTESDDRFTGIETITLPGGLPAIEGALALLETTVVKKVKLENSTLFISEVKFSVNQVQGKPLIYHNREYYSL